MTCYIFDWTWYILDVLRIKQLDELFQILNLFGKDLNLKGLEPHWDNTTLSIGPEAKRDIYNTFDPDRSISIHLDPPSTERPPSVEIKQEGKNLT